MSGFSANIVNLIADNLRDRYENGFPIIKELIQNADDAGACSFVFGDHAGFPDAQNPLLRGAGLWFFNDGVFKDSDQRAIRSFAENSKAGEGGTIGKFGLGMKSVFHLCEAFLYIAFNGADKFREVLNPWNTREGNLHPEWDKDFNDVDVKLLMSLAYPLAEKNERGFLLWVPLRTHQQLRRGDQKLGAIVPCFPIDQPNTLAFLRDEQLSRRLAAILPFLQHLNRIAYQPAEGTDGFTLSLERAHGAIDSSAAIAASIVTIRGDAKKALLDYIAQTRDATINTPFSTLKGSNYWPRTRCRDAFGHEGEAEDKSRAEGSVLVAREAGSEAGLTLQWAVFLPLDDPTHVYLSNTTSLGAHYRIVLHGQFFVDAGRRGIHDYSSLAGPLVAHKPTDDASLRRSWNYNLAQYVALPLLLPTLAQCVERYRFDDAEIAALTAALREAHTRQGERFFDRFRSALCDGQAWVRALERTGAVWRLVTLDGLRLLPLPVPPKTAPSRPWDVLPGLQRIQSVVFYDGKAPALTPPLAVWSVEDILRLLAPEEITNELISKPRLAYLNAVLEQWRDIITHDRVQRRLGVLIDNFLRNNPLHELRAQREEVRRLLGHLIPERRLALGSRDPQAGKRLTSGSLLERLWRCSCECLLIPGDLDAEPPASGTPTPADLHQWLAALHEAIDTRSDDHELALDLAAELLEKLRSDGKRESFLREHADLRILRAGDGRVQASVAVSYAELRQAYERDVLFGFASGLGRDRFGDVPKLAAVCPNARVLLLNSDAARALNFTDLRSASDRRAILHALGHESYRLGPVDVRRSILELANANDVETDANARRGLRYLLHGRSEHFHDMETRLWVQRHQQSPAWGKLQRQLIGENNWTVLDATLVENLLEKRWSSLGIFPIEPGAVLAEVQRQGVLRIEPTAFVPEELDEILAAVDSKDLWRQLPLHRFTDSSRRGIRSGDYLDTDCVLPVALHRAVGRVVASRHKDVQRQQKEWLTPLDARAVIEIALSSEAPVEHGILILDALGKLDESQIDEPLLKDLCMRPWLRLHNGGAIKPADVIDLPQLEEDLTRLSSGVDYCYAGLSDLESVLAGHEQLPRLRNRLFAQGEAALEPLGLLLGELPAHSVGDIELIDIELLNRLLPVLKQMDTLSGWALFDRLVGKFGLEPCASRLLKPQALCASLANDRLCNVLNELAALAGQGDEKAVDAFDVYLQLFVRDSAQARESLPKLLLRSQTGDWRSAAELCYGAAGVDEARVLDANQAQRLAGIVAKGKWLEAPPTATAESTGFAERINEGPAALLDRYFENWREQIPHGLVGAVLALFGSAMRSRAVDWLRPHPYEFVLDRLHWRTQTSSLKWLGRYGAAAGLDQLQFSPRLVNARSVQVLALTGDPINVPLTEHPDSLLVGQIHRCGIKVDLQLRIFNPAGRNPEELSKLLRATAEHILRHAYDQPHANLVELWEELGRSDQLSLHITRAMLLDNLPFYLKQLGAHRRSPELKQALNAHHQSVERLTVTKQDRKRSDELNTRRSDVQVTLDKLGEILVDNKAAQLAVLESVRDKLRDFQYSVDSVPFELFQNADDAVAELWRVTPDIAEKEVPDAARCFVVQTDVGGGCCWFLHWGRPINACGAVAESDDRGFSRDLEKMLMLSGSDKAAAGGEVTGRFGLGFKSVLLVSTRPGVVSGRLRFEIVGGVLPEPWSQADEALDRLRHAGGDGQRLRGTAVKLVLDEGLDGSKLLGRFTDLAGLLCVFGRAIRRIDLSNSARPQVYEWRPTPLSERSKSTIELGRCRLPIDDNNSFDTIGLAFRSSSGCVFLRLGARGFEPLPERVPSLWVTAPTHEAVRFGFAVSADFALDAGRGRLAGDTKHNKDIAIRLGNELGQALLTLERWLSEDWPNRSKELRLAEDISPSAFWSSLWRTLGYGFLRHNSGNAIDPIGCMITVRALQFLLAASNGVPSGLSHPFDRFVAVSASKRELRAPWNERDVLVLLNDWSTLAERGILSGCLSSEITAIYRQLRSECNCDEAIPPFTAAVLLQALPGRLCHPDDARRLKAIFGSDWERLKDRDGERQEAEKLARTLQFRSAAGGWREGKDLLCAQTGDEEERLRAGFAPADCRLDPEYCEAGRQFFKACRLRFEVGQEQLVDWIQTAVRPEMQAAALRFLRSSGMRASIAERLRERGLAGTWLADLGSSHPGFANWCVFEINEVQRQLIEFERIAQPEAPPAEVPTGSIEQLYEWWVNEGIGEPLKRYLKYLYPHGRSLSLHRSACGEFSRKDWMTLFTLGILRSLGRTTNQQHKGFIEMLDEKGWWRVLTQIRPQDDPHSWLQILEDYASEQTEDESFSLWMGCFPRLYRLARWLPDYVEMFESINRSAEADMLLILTPKANPAFQGGGIDAPPINRTLRFGQHFVIRELLRTGVVNNPKAIPYAYMPSRGVITLLNRLGIHAETAPEMFWGLAAELGEVRARFKDYYDIPLRIVAYSDELQWRIFRERIVETSSADFAED